MILKTSRERNSTIDTSVRSRYHTIDAMETAFDSRRNNIDFIRMFLALLVVFSHSYPLATGSNDSEPFMLLTRGQTTGGTIAVDSFFILSGFLITKSFFNSRSSLYYLVKRIRRIYPGFFVAMLFCMLAIVPLSGATLAGGRFQQFAQFLINTLRLREFDYRHAFESNPFPGAINGSAWSISYEFWCYIGVALLGLTRILQRPMLTQIAFWVTIGISIVFEATGWKPGGGILGEVFGYPPFWARLLPMYLAGVVFFLYRQRIKRTVTWAAAAAICLVIATRVPMAWSVCFPIAGSYLLLWVAYTPVSHLADFARSGDLSYGTYLYAFPVQQVIARYSGSRHPVYLFLLASPVTLLLAALSWRFVESQFLQRGRQTVITQVLRGVAGRVLQKRTILQRGREIIHTQVNPAGIQSTDSLTVGNANSCDQTDDLMGRPVALEDG